MIVFEYAAVVISVLAMLILCLGVGIATFRLAKLELGRLRGQHMLEARQLLRRQLGSYILLGLEFLIAADVIHSVAKKHLEYRDLIVLGGIVAIRTLISYFLDLEVRHVASEPRTSTTKAETAGSP